MLADISIGETVMWVSTAGLFIISLIALLRKADVKVEQPIDVNILESLASKDELSALAKASRKEFDDLWFTVRSENTAIRKEITGAVTHSQEVVMEKLEKNRVELGGQLQNMPGEIIATLRNTGAIGRNNS